MISVALCTYNGALYIQEQLNSILSQSLPVNEIVICDDGSTDDTLQILRKIQKEHPSIISLHVNDGHLGVAKNFEKALSLCNGDMVFLSDQDDIWYPNKVSTLVEILSHSPFTSLVFSNAGLIDSEGKLVSDSIDFFTQAFPSKNQLMFDVGLAMEMALSECFALGSSMALRHSFLKKVLPFKKELSESFNHDDILLFYASLTNNIKYTKERLFNYRIHEKQTAGRINPSSTHQGNNVYDKEIWPTPILVNQIEDDLLKKRVNYMKTRNQLLHNPWAPFIILKIHKLYRQLYPSTYRQIMLFDIKRSIYHSIYRLCKRVEKK